MAVLQRRPRGNWKLYAVRIAEGPQRGFAPPRKSIPPKEWAAKTAEKGADPEPKPQIKPPDEESAAVDLRTAPLPYAELRGKLDKLLAVHEFAAAKKIIDSARRDPKHDKDRLVMEWDLEDVERLTNFWQRLETAIAALMPGDVLRTGGQQIEFAKHETGKLTGKVRGSDKTISRSLDELTPQEIVALVDKQVEKNDAAAQLEIGTFLNLFPQGQPAACFVSARPRGE